MDPLGDTGWDSEIGRICERALAGPELDGPPRARVMARHAQVLVYRGEYGRADEVSRTALDTTEMTGDPDALVDALRARQLARSGPDGSCERAVIAARMLDAAHEIGSAWVEMWGRLSNGMPLSLTTIRFMPLVPPAGPAWSCPMWSNMDTGPIRLSIMSRTRPARYSSGMGPPSTRYRYLVDLAAIVLAASVEAEPQLTALRSEARRRGLQLPRPPLASGGRSQCDLGWWGSC